GAAAGDLEPGGGDASRQLSAPVTAQLFPATAELPRCVRDSALRLDGAALGGAANGLPDLTRFIRQDVADAAFHGLALAVPDAEAPLADPPARELLERGSVLRRCRWLGEDRLDR